MINLTFFKKMKNKRNFFKLGARKSPFLKRKKFFQRESF